MRTHVRMAGGGPPRAPSLPRSMRRLLGTFLLVCALTTGTAWAGRGPCLPGGPTCHITKARVLDVNDGDTIGVDVLGDGVRRRDVVRFSGIQTMELRRYHPKRRSGECHSVAATRVVERLIRRSGRIVRLSSQNPRAKQDVRLRRWVAVRSGGAWVDLGERLLRQGRALWMGGREEHAWNRRYGTAEQLAARGGRHLWNPSACGGGPAAGLPMSLWVNWDPVGTDRRHGGEWVKVRNLSPDRRLRLGGWTIRDASHLSFRFPRRYVLAPGEVAKVHTGRGRNRGDVFHWGLRRLVFENPRPGRHMGGGAYLFDRDGDIRAAMHYPCFVACAHPLRGGLALRARPRGNERVVVRNRTGGAIPLSGYALDVPGGLRPFGDRAVLQPGAAMTVEVPDNRRLRDRGGRVRVVTFSGVRIACTAWGRGRC